MSGTSVEQFRVAPDARIFLGNSPAVATDFQTRGIYIAIL